ncbi:hypothetical protein B0H10DRAFT_948285 [Mycena sp. CBHHK59/15]|nr:hypothetical protein B0H10DRAFT_948285 [Mycena sp. CBHHK59/15]
MRFHLAFFAFTNLLIVNATLHFPRPSSSSLPLATLGGTSSSARNSLPAILSSLVESPSRLLLRGRFLSSRLCYRPLSLATTRRRDFF